MRVVPISSAIAAAMATVLAAQAQPSVAGSYQSTLDSRVYEIRQRGDLGLDLYAEDGRIVAVMDRKKPGEDFKGSTHVLATKCPQNTGKIETVAVGPDRVRMRVEVASKTMANQMACNVLFRSAWESFDLMKTAASSHSAPSTGSSPASPDGAPATANGPLTDADFSNVHFHVESATAENNVVTVKMTALNQGVDRRLAVALSGGTYGGPVVQMVDDQGATHNAKTFEVGNTALGADLINGVRTPVTVVFDAMPTVAGVVQAAEIKRLSLDLRISQQAQAPQRLEVQFRNVAIQKSQAAQTDGGDRSAGGKPAAQNGPTATARGPVTEARFSDVQFQFGEAVAEGKALTVTVWLTNQGIDRTISAGNVGNGVQLIDDSGNSYTPTEVTIGNRRNTSDIVNGIRTKVTLRFELPTLGGVIQAKQIARLTVDLQVGTPQHSDSGSIRFQDAPIQKK